MAGHGWGARRLFLVLAAALSVAAAPASAAPVQTGAFEGESMTGTNVLVRTDVTTYLKWYDNTSTASKSVTPSGATQQLVIRAVAWLCNGSPSMVVKVGGATVATFPVTSTTFQDYTVSVNMAGGVAQTLTFGYTNELYKNSSCDRNIGVDRVTLMGEPASDTQAPTTPGGVTATAVSPTSVSVKWTGSTDNVGVTAYDVYRNGSTTPTASVAGTAREYVDSGLTTGTTYSYTVRARDAAGNRSAASTAASVTLGAANWSCGWGTFSLGNWPSSCWRPYSSASAINTRLPESPRLVANSSAVVANLMGTDGQGLGDGTARALRPMKTADDYYHPYFFSSSTDPEYTVYCTRGTAGAIWYGCPVNGMKLRIPTHARPAGGTDHHMNILDQAGNVEWSFFGVEPRDPAGGTLRVGLAGRQAISSTGHYPEVDTCSNAVCVGGMAGIIRQQELASGRIDHALFLVIDCSSSTRVYPANPKNVDPGCSNSIIPQGGWFRLNLTEAQIDAIPGIAGWQKTILKAIRNYGMFVGDEGSNGAIELAVESPETWAGGTNPWAAYAQSEQTKPNHNITVGSTGEYVFNFGAGLSTAWWAANLQMVDPCVIEKTC